MAIDPRSFSAPASPHLFYCLTQPSFLLSFLPSICQLAMPFRPTLSTRLGAHPQYLGITLGLSILLLACSSPSPEASANPDISQTEVTQTSRSQPQPVGQQLPITATVEISGQQIQLEVAQTPDQQATGLMYRTELADDRGMLFPFEFPRPAQFWMRNTLIPLDMVFLLNGEVKAIAANAAPCTTPTCPIYGSGVPVNQVIELRGGRAAELGLQVGDRLTIQSVPATPDTSSSSTP